MKTKTRILAASAAALAVTAVGAETGGSPAEAASTHISSNSGGANMRACAYTSCGVIYYLPNGTGVRMICWTDTQTVSPPNSNYTSARWFEIDYNGQYGFVHSSLVANQTSVGRC